MSTMIIPLERPVMTCWRKTSPGVMPPECGRKRRAARNFRRLRRRQSRRQAQLRHELEFPVLDDQAAHGGEVGIPVGVEGPAAQSAVEIPGGGDLLEDGRAI